MKWAKIKRAGPREPYCRLPGRQRKVGDRKYIKEEGEKIQLGEGVEERYSSSWKTLGLNGEIV